MDVLKKNMRGGVGSQDADGIEGFASKSKDLAGIPWRLHFAPIVPNIRKQTIFKIWVWFLSCPTWSKKF